MTGLAAPPLLALRRRSTLERMVLDRDLEIGAGGEAVVYGVPGDATLVAKLYHERGIERARKLGVMLAHPPAMPEGTATAWPADLLLDGAGEFAGFVMPRAEGPRLFEFYNPISRRETAGGFHAGRLHRAGRNLAAAFAALHAAGYVVGDVNESNLLVSPIDAGVTLVDADSLQVRDPQSGIVFRSRVGKPEFTPPELQGMSFDEVDRTETHDRFGLAVLLFLLLMEGTHPFATRTRGDGEALPVEERIRRGLFAHAGLAECSPPRLSPRFDALHPELQALFVRAFVAGHADPAARPSPAEWRDTLASAETALATCATNPLHRHAAHLAACPWCERMALLGGRDPFPAPGTAVVRGPRARAPRPRLVAAPPALAPAW
jgi:DNA-binding helix-hairpin-helix protein with protein kinase domain